jgi:hypothetical protein
MAVRVKPVQATVIRDKKIVRQVIAEVRRTPSSKHLAELRKRDKVFTNMIMDVNG